MSSEDAGAGTTAESAVRNEMESARKDVMDSEGEIQGIKATLRQVVGNDTLVSSNSLRITALKITGLPEEDESSNNNKQPPPPIKLQLSSPIEERTLTKLFDPLVLLDDAEKSNDGSVVRFRDVEITTATLTLGCPALGGDGATSNSQDVGPYCDFDAREYYRVIDSSGGDGGGGGDDMNVKPAKVSEVEVEIYGPPASASASASSTVKKADEEEEVVADKAKEEEDATLTASAKEEEATTTEEVKIASILAGGGGGSEEEEGGKKEDDDEAQPPTDTAAEDETPATEGGESSATTTTTTDGADMTKTVEEGAKKAEEKEEAAAAAVTEESAATSATDEKTATSTAAVLCTVQLRVEYIPSKKDQKDKLYEALNNASKKKAAAIDRLRKSAAALSRAREASGASASGGPDSSDSTTLTRGGGGDKGSSSDPAVKKGFLNKKGNKKGPGEPSFLMRWYDRVLGPNSIIIRVFPVAKNYVLFFGVVALMHYKGDNLALPAPL